MSIVKLPTAKTSGNVVLSEMRALFYGNPKIGKTTLASGFPDSLFLATEPGYESMEVFATDIKSWQDFKDCVKLIMSGKHEFKTIVIDTVDILVRLCNEHICKELNIEHISDKEWAKGYDYFKKTFEAELNKLFMSKYGVILISHSKLIDQTVRGGSITKTVSTLPNYARSIIIPKVAIIGLIKLKTMKQGTKYVEQRVVSFKPDELAECGDRWGYFPDEIVLKKDGRESYKVFEYFYNKALAARNKKKEEEEAKS